jgi:4-diphosphocytidyl-2-C-methyl-D-erythritol kinase
MSAVIVESAKAKVNLALHVLGRRADGYHELDSIVAFADIADVVQVEEAAKLSLECSGPFAADVPGNADNLILRAHSLLCQHVTLPMVRVHLRKNLPVAAGIGGGSADAAAALRALMRLAQVSLPADILNGIAVSLGADVPVCLRQRACRMQGIGEHLTDIPQLPAPAILLVNPGMACATAAVFAALDLAKGARHLGGLAVEDPGSWRNDLAAPARKVQPVISDVLAVLASAPRVHAVRMSGSGSTCFGLFHRLEDAQNAALHVKARHAGWWSVAALLA